MRLLTPLKTESLTLRNRVVLAPLVRARCDDERAPTPIMGEYYAQRASAGLLITEGTHVSPYSATRKTAAGHHTDRQNEAWKHVVSRVHEAGGVIFQQLYHVGRKAISESLPGGALPVAPSAIAANGGIPTPNGLLPFPTPRALESDEIRGVIAEFHKAVRYAAKAGFDGVELAASSGFLIEQFLKDGTNLRTDAYGGTLEKRARFLLEIADGAAEIIGPDRIGVRLTPHFRADGIEDSDTIATYTYVSKELSRRGLAYLHVQEGTGRDDNPRLPLHLRQLDRKIMIGPSGDEPFLAPLFRQHFSGPLILNGNYDARSAEQVVADGTADAVSFGRMYISNPDLVDRFRLNAQLAEPDTATYYSGGAKGYTDYPTLTA
ncbi:alkene reductase [Neorhizobium sp. JUb45]|uniref:alkene reductase n=1 Tax=Neorhizobium sp. JUb45 TaxID=2485113 RepID=UPI00104CEFBF|nr:alkene reductase [Neorhizobium sp. JUb45]TCQ99087.1 N-ethylmaleimide reductase [Neorhizobium sp. JUb45]